MQQTEKYKLNLIEPSDPFLPDALNANTQQLENVVSQHLDAMDQRVTVLEGTKIAFGTYSCPSTGDQTVPYFVPLPFTPKLVMVKAPVISSKPFDAITFAPGPGITEHRALKVVEGGFTVQYDYNCYIWGGDCYCYFAFA